MPEEETSRTKSNLLPVKKKPKSKIPHHQDNAILLIAKNRKEGFLT